MYQECHKENKEEKAILLLGIQARKQGTQLGLSDLQTSFIGGGTDTTICFGEAYCRNHYVVLRVKVKDCRLHFEVMNISTSANE